MAGATESEAHGSADRPGHDTERYTRRLSAERAWWKRLLNTQAPFRWNVRRLVDVPVLDVGCGVGRNLLHLDGRGVGVDSNEHSVAEASRRGLTVHTAADFPSSPDARPGGYATLLIAHVLEHMRLDEAEALVAAYLPYVRADGQVIVIVPQEAGFRSDDTHVAPVGRPELERLAAATGLELVTISSFPLPRFAGRFLRYNETVARLRRLDVAAPA